MKKMDAKVKIVWRCLFLFPLLLMYGCTTETNLNPLLGVQATDAQVSATVEITPVDTLPTANFPSVGTSGLGELENITLENVTRLTPLAVIGEGDFSDEIAVSPDGNLLAIAAKGGIILADITGGQRVGFFQTQGKVENLTFSPDGSQIAGMSRFFTGKIVSDTYQNEGLVYEPLLSVYSVFNRTLLYAKPLAAIGCGEFIAWNASYSPDGLMIALRGINNFSVSQEDASAVNLCLLAASDGNLIKSIQTPASSLSNHLPLLFTPDGQQLITAINDPDQDEVQIGAFDVASAKLLSVYTGVWINDLALSPDGQWLAIAGQEGVQIQATQNGTQAAFLQAHEGQIYSVAFSPDGKTMALGSEDGCASLWKIPEGILLWKTSDPPTYPEYVGRIVNVPMSIRDVAFSVDGSRIFLLRQNMTLNVSNMVEALQTMDGKMEYRVYGRNNRGNAVLSPDASLAAFGGYEDGQIQLWSTLQNERVSKLSGHTAMVLDVAFSPDGAQIASASEDGTVRLWKTSEYTMQHSLASHIGTVSLVGYSADGTRLASIGDDAILRIWNTSNGNLLQSIPTKTGD